MTANIKTLEQGIHSVENKGWVYEFYDDGRKFVLTTHSKIVQHTGYTVTGKPMRFADLKELLSYLSECFCLTMDKLLDIIK